MEQAPAINAAGEKAAAVTMREPAEATAAKAAVEAVSVAGAVRAAKAAAVVRGGGTGDRRAAGQFAKDAPQVKQPPGLPPGSRSASAAQGATTV
jgi:hypothetical protein